MAEAGESGRAVNPFRFLGRSLFVDVALPWLTVRILEAYGVPTVWALAVAALFPGASTLLAWFHGRRIEVIGIAVFVTIVLGIAMALISDEARFGLLRGAPAFGLFGIACLISLLMPRPLMFFVARHFQTAGDPAKAAEWSAHGSRGLSSGDALHHRSMGSRVRARSGAGFRRRVPAPGACGDRRGTGDRHCQRGRTADLDHRLCSSQAGARPADDRCRILNARKVATIRERALGCGVPRVRRRSSSAARHVAPPSFGAANRAGRTRARSAR
jgi:hypothetical protein